LTAIVGPGAASNYEAAYIIVRWHDMIKQLEQLAAYVAQEPELKDLYVSVDPLSFDAPQRFWQPC
jgi:hypothetical protein